MALLDEKRDSCADSVSSASRIFAEYGGFINRIIRYKAKDRDRENDLYQGFFLFLVSKPILPDVQNMESYLYKMITNYLNDADRRMRSNEAAIKKYVNNFDFSINEEESENMLIS